MGEDAPVVSARVVAVVVLSLLAAGCGSSANTTPPVTTAQHPRPAAFGRCMRSNGVAYPDVGKPTPQQLGISQSRFDAAVNACRGLLPHGGVAQETPQQRRTRLADGLSFARCMRGHGVVRFPDPDAQGQLTLEMVQAQGIDVHSPQILRVVQTCLPASHGLLTPAKVRQALSRGR